MIGTLCQFDFLAKRDPTISGLILIGTLLGPVSEASR